MNMKIIRFEMPDGHDLISGSPKTKRSRRSKKQPVELSIVDDTGATSDGEFDEEQIKEDLQMMEHGVNLSTGDAKTIRQQKSRAQPVTYKKKRRPRRGG